MNPLDSPFPLQRLESKLAAACTDSRDTVEGFKSFMQRRDPEFTGRVSTDLPPFLPWLND